MNNIKNLWLTSFKALQQSWQQVFIAHLIVTALGVIVFSPLMGITGQLLLKVSGQPALADQDIAYFLLSPFGIIALIIFSALLIAIVAFEQAVLMRIAIGVIHQQPISVINALYYVFGQAKPLFEFTLRLVVRIFILVMPFIVIMAAIAFLLLTDHDINFYLTEKPPKFWLTASLIISLSLVMLVLLARKLLSWLLALPLVLFNNITPKQAFEKSQIQTKGKSVSILSVFISWLGISLLLGAILLGIIKFIGSSTIPQISHSISLLVILLGGLTALWGLSNFLLTALTSASFSYLVMGFYQHSQLGFNPSINKHTAAITQLKKFHFSTVNIAIFLIMSVITSIMTGAWLINNIQANDKVIIVAHRGAAGKAPENTLAAIKQAIDDKTDWVEIDVQETADGEVVVIHDSDFMKLAGNPLKVWETNLAEMQQIDIGSWFNASFSQQRVPTLKEVLETAKGKVKVVIELKYYGHDKKLEQAVVDIVEQLDMVSDTAIMSLKYSAIQKIRRLRPHWQIGLLSATAIGDLTHLDSDFLAVAMNMANSSFIRHIHKANKKIFVWTVNDRVSMSRMMSLGVDGIITDEPEMARQVLAERTKLSSAERLLIHTALLFGETITPKNYRDESP